MGAYDNHVHTYIIKKPVIVMLKSAGCCDIICCNYVHTQVHRHFGNYRFLLGAPPSSMVIVLRLVPNNLPTGKKAKIRP